MSKSLSEMIEEARVTDHDAIYCSDKGYILTNEGKNLEIDETPLERHYCFSLEIKGFRCEGYNGKLYLSGDTFSGYPIIHCPFCGEHA